MFYLQTCGESLPFKGSWGQGSFSKAGGGQSGGQFQPGGRRHAPNFFLGLISYLTNV